MHASIKNILVTLISLYLILFVLPEGTVLASLTGLRLVATDTYLGIAMPDTLPYPTNISNWQVVSSNGLSFTIGKAVDVLEQGTVNVSEPVILKKSERAVLVPGPSPVGVSFKRNICSGFLGQFQEFSPQLPKECPAVDTTGLKPSCVEYVQTIPRCEIPVNGLRLDQMDLPCKTLVKEKVNYASCVAEHRNDPNFESDEWRIYPTPTIASWDNKNVYKLLDEGGHLMGVFSTER